MEFQNQALAVFGSWVLGYHFTVDLFLCDLLPMRYINIEVAKFMISKFEIFFFGGIVLLLRVLYVNSINSFSQTTHLIGKYLVGELSTIPTTPIIPSRQRSHIPPGEKENHRLKSALKRGNGSQEGKIYHTLDPMGIIP